MISRHDPKFTVKRVREFSDWLGTLDPATLAIILEREKRMAMGSFGDWKSVGDAICETRIHVGHGLRIYYVKAGNTLVPLLHGGSKRSQAQDIDDAKAILTRLKLRREAIKRRDSEQKS